jgi:hypothetical protein
VCFSMSASIAAGTALVATGAVTLALVRDRGERPLALLPLLFGVQQLVEGVVWWSLDHQDAPLNVSSTFAYTLFSHVLWPVLVPFAMLSLETVPWRRKALRAFLGLGALVSLEGLRTVLGGPRGSHVTGSSIQYAMPSLFFVALYLVATCVGAMVSSHRLLVVLGAGALGLALITLWLYEAVFVSVWCFFSAILTLMIVGFFWSRHRRATGTSSRARLEVAPPVDRRARGRGRR